MKKPVLTLLFAELLFFGIVPLVRPTSDLSTVRVEGGQVSGTLSRDGDVRAFKGIPFAAPPVGNLRWKAPQPVPAWTGVRVCNAFGPSPVQGSPAPFGPWSAEYLIPKEPISEDCLYLNVWSGARSAGEKRPVLVWIYGGGFGSGGTACPIYDGESTAKKGIIFVSANYRVGPFGFFAHPELTNESGHNASGNYGLMDQLAALRWVQKNIRAFGGDPANVTIAGQSAGSMSVNCLVASPLAKGLFTKAIAESGANFTSAQPSLQQAEETGLKMAQALGVSSLAELRAKPADEVLKKAMGRGPIADGYVLPQSVAEIFAAGRANDVLLLTGWNEDEGTAFGAPKKADDYRQQLQQQYGAKADELLKFYPAGTETEALTSQQQLARDMIFGVQNYIWANGQARRGKTAYVYRFTRKVPATGDYVKYGAFHTAEVPYAYDNLRFVNHQLRPLDAVDTQLANRMAAYWANFIKTGDPNGKGLPQWPVYAKQDGSVMVFGDNVTAQPLPDGPALNALLSVMRK